MKRPNISTYTRKGCSFDTREVKALLLEELVSEDVLLLPRTSASSRKISPVSEF
jgi:hypothetical protein